MPQPLRKEAAYMDSAKYLGLDVHKESISIAVLNAAGKIIMEGVIQTKAIVASKCGASCSVSARNIQRGSCSAKFRRSVINAAAAHRSAHERLRISPLCQIGSAA